jgi:type IV secretion system protein VirB4
MLGKRYKPIWHAATPETKDHIWTALISLASAPRQERTLTGLSVLLQSNVLKRALQPYCLGGPYDRLLDAENEHLGTSSVQVFETDGLIGTAVAPAVLAYLFHRIESRFDGRPTLLVIDEGWLALDDADFAGKLREWLKTLRKKNASVVFATQSLADIDGSAIAPAIIESCPTRILLPNDRAIEPQIMTIYRHLGSMTDKSKSWRERYPSETTIASRAGAIACSNSGSAKLRSR